MDTNGNAELSNLSESGAPPKKRIASSSHLVAIADKYIEHDEEAAYLRSRAQALVNGEAPYDSDELRDKGLTHIVNANFGEASAIMEAALAPYIELQNGVPRVANVIMESYEGDSNEDSEIISQEFDWMLKEWCDFSYNMQLLSREFVGDGVGVAMWPDERTIFWEPCGLKDFKVARDTKVSDEAIEVSIVTRNMSVSQLYHYIRNPKAAKAMGWNIDAVKKAIWKASTKSDQWKNYTHHWEDFERQVKESDLYSGESAYHRAQLIYGYNREFDGKFTQLIASRDADEFLYERFGKYSNVNSCFVIFTYGVGQGTFHTIRGLKQKIYNQIQVSNRILCQAAQAAITAGLIQLQGDSEAIQDFQYIEVGPYTFIPNGLTPIQLTPPAVATQGIPVYNLMAQTLQNNTGSYRSRSVTPEGQARSATEVVQQARQESTLNAAALELFYTPYNKLLTEQYRRAVSPLITPNDKGGRLALEFRARCKRQGVSIERMRQFLKVTAMRAMGDGSPVMTEMASKQLMELYSLMDEKGKENVLRAVVAGIPGVGYQKVDLFVPEKGPRRIVDFDIANLENGNLRQGIQQIVHDSQNHAVHIEAHIPLMAEIIELHRQQQMPDEQAMQILRPLADHTTQHLVLFSSNSFRKQEVNELKRQLQNVTAYVDELEQQVINRMMSEQNKMQEEALAGQDQGQQPDPKQMLELQKAQLKLAEMQEKRMMNQEAHAQRLETIRQQMALNDPKTRSSILQKVSPSAAPAGTGRPPLATEI
jgi:hypothetical protein